MRMLEVFSSESTYLPILQDSSYVVSVIEQILHYMLHNGKWGKPVEVGIVVEACIVLCAVEGWYCSEQHTMFRTEAVHVCAFWESDAATES